MKKIYLSVLALSIGTVSFGQALNGKSFAKDNAQLMTHDGTVSNAGPTSSKAPGDVIWSEDFTGGIPAGWTMTDNTSNNYVWVLNSADISNNQSTPPGYTNATAIASVSGGNHMLLFGDEYNRIQLANTGNATDMDSYFQTTGIPLTGQPGISVEFQQKFRRCCANGGIEVNLVASMDPTFTTGVGTYDITAGIATNAQSPDPINMSINISDIAGGQTGMLYLRWHVAAGSSHYYWMIDDINVVETVENDITTQQASYSFYGCQYTRLPANHIRPADFSMASNNIGSVDQPSSNLTVTVTDNNGTVVHTDNTNDTIIPSLSVDTFYLDNNWTPPATPLNVPYTITLDILSDDSTDATPANNTYTFPPLQITSNIMAIDDYSATPTSRNGNSGLEYEICNQVDATVNDDVHAIQIVVGEDSQIGSLFDLVIYKTGVQGGAYVYTELYRSGDANYTVDASMINVATDFRLEDASGNPTPLALEADSTYFVGIHSYSGFDYAASGAGPLIGTPTARHSSVTSPTFSNPAAGQTFGISNTPMIRLNFDAQVGVDQANETTQFNVYPNPSKGIFTVNLDAELAKTVKVIVE